LNAVLHFSLYVDAYSCVHAMFTLAFVFTNTHGHRYGVSDDGTKRGASEVRHQFTHVTGALLHHIDPCSMHQY
jgi:hypothetical protein